LQFIIYVPVLKIQLLKSLASKLKLSKTYLVCTFLLSLIPLLGISQHCDFQISGTVTDKGPNTPLPYVNVIIQELHKGVLTDENGSLFLWMTLL